MQEEEILGKAYDARLMRRMLRYLKPYGWHVAAAIGLSIVVSAMEAVRPYFVKVRSTSTLRRRTPPASSAPRSCSSS